MNQLLSTAKKNLGDTCSTETARLNLEGIYKDATHRRAILCASDPEGTPHFWPLAEGLKRADQFNGLDWLESVIQGRQILLHEIDAEIWASWRATRSNLEVAHA
jgi:hypothetical protein